MSAGTTNGQATAADRARATAKEFERHAWAYFLAAAHLRAHAERMWPQ